MNHLNNVLQVERWRFRSPIVGSPEFFFDIILPAAIRNLGSTQPLTEIRTRKISWWVKAAGAYGLPYQLHVPNSFKPVNLKLLNPHGLSGL